MQLSARGRFAAVMGLIGSGHALSHFYLLALPPLFPLLSAEFGVGITELALLVTLLNLATVAAQFPASILIDRFGARHMLIGGLALMGVCFAAIATVSSYWVAAALVVLAGVGNSVFHPADYAIINASVEEGRLGRAYSLHTFTGNIGFMSAPAAMILLSSLAGWRGALFAAGALAILVTALMVAFGALLRDDRAVAGNRGAPASAAPRHGTGTAAILTSGPVLMMFTFYVFIAMATGGMQTISVSALVAHQGLDLGDANLALEVFLVSAAAGVLLGGPLADRTRRHGLTATLAMGGSALLIFLVGAVGLPLAAIAVLFGLYGLLQGSMRPARDMMTRAITPPGATGRVFGFVTGGLNVGGAVSPVLLGWLVDSGHPEAAFYAIATILLLGVTTVGVARGRQAVSPSAAE